eukprot:1153391-Pelagomonas_calceolata.AAC.4
MAACALRTLKKALCVHSSPAFQGPLGSTTPLVSPVGATPHTLPLEPSMQSSLDLFDVPSPASSISASTIASTTPPSPASHLQQLRKQQQQQQPMLQLQPSQQAKLRELPARFRALPVEVQLRILQLCHANPVVTVRGKLVPPALWRAADVRDFDEKVSMLSGCSGGFSNWDTGYI